LPKRLSAILYTKPGNIIDKHSLLFPSRGNVLKILKQSDLKFAANDPFVVKKQAKIDPFRELLESAGGIFGLMEQIDRPLPFLKAADKYFGCLVTMRRLPRAFGSKPANSTWAALAAESVYLPRV
jgi:hypothetical protein